MRRPPYLPFLSGPPSLSPGLKPIDPGAWLAPDSEAFWLPEKRAVMRDHRDEAYASCGADAAVAELAAAISGIAGPTTESWPTPLEGAASRVSDDLCVLERDDAGLWRLKAASLCAPTFWSLTEKIGQPLSGLHAPVPGANDGMVARVHRMFDAIRPGQVLERFNWTVQAGDARFTPSSAPLKALARETPDDAACEVLHLRVERQTITKLPETGAVVFTIRIVIDPLMAALSKPDQRAAFRASWEGIDPVLATYKGWPVYERLVRAALSQLS